MLFYGEAIAPRDILEQAQDLDPIPTLVVGADKPLVMESVKRAVAENLIVPTLLGDEAGIRKCAEGARYALDDVECVFSNGNLVETMVERVSSDGVGAIMKGFISTHDFMSGLLDRRSRVVQGARLTHAMHVSFPWSDRHVIISDAALNVAPDRATMKAIIRNAVTMAHRLGIERPKVALLSATEKVNPAMPSSQIAAGLAHWAEEHLTDCDVSGPLAFDNAVSPRAVEIKGIKGDPVAGQADILIVPNIETGNVLFKALVYCAGACSAGLVIGGRIPIILTSRAAPPPARLTAAALAAIVRNHEHA